MDLITLVLSLVGCYAAGTGVTTPTKLTVSAAVERARRNSPVIESAAMRVRAALEDVRMARAMRIPGVTAGIIAGAADPEAMYTAREGPSAGASAMLGRQASAAVALAAMAPVYTGGHLESAVRRAEAELDQAQAELAAEEARVVSEVKTAYYRAVYATTLLAVAEADREAARAMAENARAEWEAGRGIEASYLRATAREREAERAVVAATAERSIALLDMFRAMGEGPGSDIELVDDPEIEAPFATVRAALEAAAASSPELVMARKRLASAAHGLSVARASQRPQVYAAFMGSLSGASDRERRTSALVGLAATVPLFDGGLRRDAARKAEAERLAAEASLRGTILDIETRVRTAWTALEAARVQLTAALAAVEAARAAYDVIRLRVLHQKSILVEELDALMAVRQAEEAVARARLEMRLACVQLERITGRR